MQCGSCHFENLPGAPVCGRCGAQLQLAAVAIDVHPPRAGRLQKRLHRWLPLYSIYGLVDRFRAWTLARVPLPDADLTVGTFLRMAIPGWPQIHRGQNLRGLIFLAAYLTSMLLWLLFLGTDPGSLLLGLTLALHASSVLDAVFTATRDTDARVVYGLLFLGLVAAAVYLPAGWAVRRVATPRRLLLDATPFHAGDVILFNPSAYAGTDPQPGDVVLYRIPRAQFLIPQAQFQGNQAIYVAEGERIDRILARAGQMVKFHRGQWLVDGKPSPWLPLNPDAPPDGLTWHVPTGYYLILPSTTPPPLRPIIEKGIWQNISLVARQDILGRAYLRRESPWRYSRIR